MSRLLDRPVPEPGTKTAVRYWNARVRDAAREVDRALAAGDYDTALMWAEDLSGTAGEVQVAVEALA